eukprot:2195488-Prymnesium_polylepis.1
MGGAARSDWRVRTWCERAIGSVACARCSRVCGGGDASTICHSRIVRRSEIIALQSERSTLNFIVRVMRREPREVTRGHGLTLHDARAHAHAPTRGCVPVCPDGAPRLPAVR